jgi:hypothetical protein
MKQQLLELEQRAIRELESITDLSVLETFRITYLGKKGELKAAMKKVGTLPASDRPEMGKLANQIKVRISHELETARARIESAGPAEDRPFDPTLPGRRPKRGHLHPITQVNNEICQILSKMGYQIVKGPNIELEYYNFEALNIPKDHPARDMQDTFYLSHSRVLRTQTSPMQVRVMEKQAPPVSIISPGKDHFTWKSLQTGLGCVPYTHVSSGGGSSRRSGCEPWGSKGNPDQLCTPNVRFRHEPTISPKLLSFYGTQRRGRYPMCYMQRAGMPDMLEHGLARNPRLRHG